MSPAVKRDLGDLLSRLTAEETDRREYGRLLVALTGALTAGARVAGARAALTGRWLTDVVVEDVAPHLPVRDLLTLRTHHGGRSGDDLAQALIRNAAITTSSLGAAAGALAAAEMVAPPTLLAAPFQLAAETLAVIAIEVKLVAELHVVYGQAPEGTRSQLATAYLTAWAARRPVDTKTGSAPLSALLSAATKQQLRRRVIRRSGRNLSAFAPFLTGAVAGAELNRRETRGLGETIKLALRPRR